VKWVYLSGRNGSLIPPMQELGRNGTSRYLETMISSEVAGLLNPDRMDNNPEEVADVFGLD